MSNNAEFDRLSGSVLDMIPDEDNRKRAAILLRMVFRAGTRSGLSYRYGELDEAVVRVRWLADHDFVNEDVKTLLAEVETRREEDRALAGTHGLTDTDIRSMLAEGFHTAFRKAVDHPYAVVIRHLIKDLPPEDWTAVLDFAIDPVISALRAAEEQEKAGQEGRL